MNLKRHQGFPRRRLEADSKLWLPNEVIANTQQANLSIQWDFFTQERPRTFDGYTGVGKLFVVDDKLIFSSELHPLSRIPSIYGPNNNLLVKTEEDYIPLRQVSEEKYLFLEAILFCQRLRLNMSKFVRYQIVQNRQNLLTIRTIGIFYEASSVRGICGQ